MLIWVSIRGVWWTNWKSQSINQLNFYSAPYKNGRRRTAVCSTRLRSTWLTSVHQSQTFPADVIYGQPLNNTWLYQHFRSSGLLCCRSNSLELATGQSPWPGAHQQQLQTNAEDESV